MVAIISCCRRCERQVGRHQGAERGKGMIESLRESSVCEATIPGKPLVELLHGLRVLDADRARAGRPLP